MTALGRTTSPTPTSRGGRRRLFFACLLAYFTHIIRIEHIVDREDFLFLFRPCSLAGAAAAAATPAANMPLSDQIPIVGVFSLSFFPVLLKPCLKVSYRMLRHNKG